MSLTQHNRHNQDCHDTEVQRKRFDIETQEAVSQTIQRLKPERYLAISVNGRRSNSYMHKF